jgi:hypothetical protein
MKSKSKKPAIVVKDLKAKKNPKGGAVDMFIKIGSPSKAQTASAARGKFGPST